MSGFNTLINIFICEDSIDGIFTAIYMAWEEGTSHTDISCIFDAKNSNYSFFETYTYVKADCNISNKVIRSIQQKLGDYVYSIIFRVINSNEPSKASVVYHSVQKLFKYGKEYINNIAPGERLMLGKINNMVLDIDGVEYFNVVQIYLNDKESTAFEILQTVSSKMLYDEIIWWEVDK